ncbi:MAG: 50S ribosomal protein L11 methyltransferase [Chromatiales bacterium]|jgi:ribosomal protein L11 methyltransferase|nr:50S ribosomal protein L11 methyltransferase [Chromatiales bacterium]MDX9766650.1 50S ribosomal protein L11 methyltransferase [Ectothiorhodospiraceae bacterium]
MYQLTVSVPPVQVEATEDLLLAGGAASVTLRDAGDHPLLEPLPGETPLWPEVLVSGLFEDDVVVDDLRQLLADNLGIEPDALRMLVEPVAERDWVRAWMDDFQPMRFGERLWICPSNHAPPDPQAVNILLDPGLAFGTGTHPTTALCLQWLDAHPPKGLDVIDYGCGSGILGIAALKLGARHVRAVDIDPQALTATLDNAARNAIPERYIETLHPDALTDADTDLLLANILSGPLVELAPRLAALVRGSGAIVLSGILAEQAAAVQAAYLPWFRMTEPTLQDGWVRLQGTRLPL